MLKVDQISTFYGKVQALDRASIEVGENEIVSIIGANGAGKSTMMRSIMGLVHPKSGTITYQGENITNLKTNQIVSRGIVYVPEGREVFPELSVEENLEMGAFSRKYTAAKMRSLLEEQYAVYPRLKERRKQAAGTLSGGEQQMLAIARGMMSEPKMIMFDEPSLGLAPLVVQDIFSIIREINRQGVTVLLIEQNANMALKIADLAYVLETGNITMSGTGAELLANEKIKEAYLGKHR